MTTPTIKWTDLGLIAPKEPDILAGRLSDLNDASGGRLNTTNLFTPQGQVATADTVIIGQYNDILLQIVNNIDPRFSSGFIQDAIGQLYFVERKPATSTVVDVICTGAIDEVIPQGAKARDLNGNVYQSLQDGQIQLSGDVTIPFENIATGDIACPIGSITQIYDRLGAFGWESVSNAVDGSIGSNVESRADFESRRTDSVFLGSIGQLDSVYAAVFNVKNVTDVFAHQNLTALPVSIGATSYTINPGEVFICVKGGISKDIATAIYSKIVGTTLIGNTSVSFPVGTTAFTNIVKFNRPDAYQIKFEVNIKSSTLLPADIVNLVKNAIVSAFNGGDGGEKARIGATVYASRYYAPVSLIDSSVGLISILVGNTTPTLTSIDVGVDKYPSLSAVNITVNLI